MPSRKIIKTETETSTNVQHQSSFITFSNRKWGFVYSFGQSLINLPLSRGYFGSWGPLNWRCYRHCGRWQLKRG